MKKTQRHNYTKIIGILVISMILTCFPTISINAATTTPEQQFRELYISLMKSGDDSVQDVSSLNLPYMTCYNIAKDVQNNECFLEYQCYNTYHYLVLDEYETKNNVLYLKKFHMCETDDDFQQCYTNVKNIVAEVQKGIDDKMTNLDKLLLFHEYIVANVYYKNTNSSADHFGGPTLSRRYGVCEGYAKALMIFLRKNNITCELVVGGNHAWVAVKIDNEWYLVDPTWDDTSSSSYGTHYFFLRNDNEFYTTLTRKHSQGKILTDYSFTSTGAISTSTKYTNWYVHDVRGQMHYYDGHWYYVSNNAIKKNNIQGTAESTLFTGKNLKITGIEGRYLNFTCDGEKKQLDLGEKTPTVPETPSDDNTPASPENPTDENNTPSSTEDTTDENNTPSSTENPDNSNTPASSEDLPIESKTSNVRTPIIKSVTNKKGKKIKIVLKENVANATGYEVKLSTDKKFRKSVKTATFKGTSKTISKLKKNTTYYVKVRAYKKNSSGKKVYGSYSSVTKVKIKK